MIGFTVDVKKLSYIKFELQGHVVTMYIKFNKLTALHL